MLALKIAIATLIFAAGLSGPGGASTPEAPSGESDHQPRVSLLVVPQGLLPEDLGAIEGAAVGLMNPGLGDVGADQTWLDVSQGARAFDTKYNTTLDTLLPVPPVVSGWEKVLIRARSAGADIRPGLLGSVLRRGGLVPEVSGSATDPQPSSLALAGRAGRLSAAPPGCPGLSCVAPVTVAAVSLQQAARLARERERGEMVIVIESPPATEGEQLAIAIAGPGFSGTLLSDSTRTPGYVLSTDLAPTILVHMGLAVPSAMTGLPVASGGRVDFGALAELEGRYRQVGESKGTAMLFPLLAWILVAAAVSLGGGRRMARPALTTLCLAVVMLPAVLLLTASISPSAWLESLIAGLLPVAGALLIARLLPGWQGLAVACAITVCAFAVDLVAGLALTPKAVIGPNPGLGARFYGIGNELESTLMILTSAGTGAAIQSWGRDLSRRGAAAAFLAAGLAGTVVFASGSFGADVGAAIIFPVAAVVAAALVAGRPQLVWLGLLAAALALALLAATDALTGAETHFVRSLFGAGSSESAFEVLVDRLQSTGQSFTRLSRLPLTLIAACLIVLAWIRRSWIGAQFDGRPAIRAGLAAAAAGSLAGALTNDSGALFIQVGVLYTGLLIAFAWAQPHTRTGV